MAQAGSVDLGIKAPRGGAWSLGQVQRVVHG